MHKIYVLLFLNKKWVKKALLFHSYITFAEKIDTPIFWVCFKIGGDEKL